MATIPIGQGPRVNLQNVPLGQQPGVGGRAQQAIADLGGTVLRVGLDSMASQARLDSEEMQRQKATAEAAAKARDQLQLQDIEDSLANAHDELGAQVKTGAVPKTAATTMWAEQSKKIVEDSLPGFSSDQMREFLAPRLARVNAKLDRSVRKVVEEKDREDITADMTTRLERLQREYQADPSKAEKEAMAVYDTLGPFSKLDAAQLAKSRQTWKEGAQFTLGYSLVQGAQHDRKALDSVAKALGNAEYLPELDPQRRAQLQDKVTSYRFSLDQKAELVAQRSARQEQARLNKAEAAWKAGNDMATLGLLDPAYAESLRTTMQGTPYEAAFREMLKQQSVTGPIAARGQGDIRAEIDALNTKLATAASPEVKHRRDLLERIADGQESAVQKDGLLRAATTYGVVSALPVVDFSQGLVAAAQQVQARMPAAQIAATWAKDRGGNAPPVEVLYPQEALALKQTLDAVPPKERAQALAALSTTLGREASAGIAAQLERITKGSALPERAAGYAMAMQDSMTPSGRLRGEMVLRGAEAMRNGTSTKTENPVFGVPPARWQAVISDQLEGFPDPQARQQITEAATLIAHGLAAEGGGKLDKDGLRQALVMAAGGELVGRGVEVTRNGKRQAAMIPLPAGKTEDDLDKALRAVTPESIGGKPVLAGGQQVPADVFVREVLPRAPLVPVSPGVYAPVVDGRTVRRADGKRLTVEVR